MLLSTTPDRASFGDMDGPLRYWGPTPAIQPARRASIRPRRPWARLTSALSAVLPPPSGPRHRGGGRR